MLRRSIIIVAIELLWLIVILLSISIPVVSTDTNDNNEKDSNSHIDNTNKAVLSNEQINFYNENGYVYTKNLLSIDMIDQLSNAVRDAAIIASQTKQNYGTYFSLIKSGGIFLPTTSSSTSSTTTCSNNNTDNNNENDNDTTTTDSNTCINTNITNDNDNTNNTNNNHIYRQVVIESIIPNAVAQLMNLDSTKGDNLRVFRDIALVKDIHETKTCDWHVDDIGFWPIAYDHTRGINVWIALDDMEYGGNMAVSPKSHVASWRYDAYSTIGQNRTVKYGPTQEEVIDAQKTKSMDHYPTCNMHIINETLFNTIESTAIFFNHIKKGDIIFLSRLLFHRTMPVTMEGIEYYNSIQQQFLHRYSIRYEPGNAQIQKGFNVEWSVLFDHNNGGRTLNDVASIYTQYGFYPQVWPTIENNYISKINYITQYSEQWMKQAKQVIYDTLFASSTSTTTSSTSSDTATIDKE